jgi:plastocyanin
VQKALGLIAAVAGILIILAASARIVRMSSLKRTAPAREETASLSVPQVPMAAKATVALSAPAVAPKGGAIRGQVLLDGPAPALRRLKLDADAYCAALYPVDRPLLSDEVITGEGGGLANVIVSVARGLGSRSFPAPSGSVTLRQRGCRYEPRVFVVRAGQPIVVTNEDDTTHNVHPLPDANPEANCTGRPNQPVSFTFHGAERAMKFKCDIHPWMTAWCHVTPHPYAAVTSTNGAFAFGDLDPGEYTIEVWHEKYGTQSKSVVVDGDVELQFGYKP